ncbi:hypothetical protein PspLS_09518 [Pyricularia sp. CBS 133598]|nr:hypothetical protein PspLS_09518 [Pyricularia sp. CBS 133598]
MGSAKYHARIRFQDDSPNWLMRVPRVVNCAVGLPKLLAGYLIHSDFRAHGNGTDQGFGLSFLLMEKLPGKSWQGDGIDGKLASEEDKANRISWLNLLPTHPIPKAGSLTLQGSDIQVSAVASGRFVSILTWYTALKDNAAHPVRREGHIQQGEEKLYLRHVDDKGDHLLVDDVFNITGIID